MPNHPLHAFASHWDFYMYMGIPSRSNQKQHSLLEILGREYLQNLKLGPNCFADGKEKW